ncbi:MAG: hypothetical protein CM15mV4_1770 [Caudoviricetes sp.]|nr:MAG: hypothetical protein CM15mV4_1770 [Caudoviricetes sp.]
MGFLDTVIKDSGNEFASKVSEGSLQEISQVILILVLISSMR